MQVIKKSGQKEPFDGQKIIDAVHQSARRAEEILTASDNERIVALVLKRVADSGLSNEIPVRRLHNFVELALDDVNKKVADSYRNYRNYRQVLAEMMQNCMDYSLNLLTNRENENANVDSDLVAVKQALSRGYLGKQLYSHMFLTAAEKEAEKDGFIYIHDKSSRRDTMNCCLFDIKAVLENGFTMGNMHYGEPKTLPTFFGVVGDIVLSCAAQQYGGFTLPQIDKVAEKYVKRSYDYEVQRLLAYEHVKEISALSAVKQNDVLRTAYNEVVRQLEQGFQEWEYKFNTVGSSRGDYPFTTLSFGLAESEFGQLFNSILLRVRRKGEGEQGIPVLFPKLVFLYDEKLHGEGAPMEELFEEAVSCTQKTMYPDYLSLSGKGYIASMYQKYGVVISPMGCRAFLSPWYEKGGMEPADETDRPIYEGRFNIGVVSLHLPMIFMKAKQESRDFFEVLDYYLEMIRQIHLRTYAYLSQMRASCNPVAYCEGGFYGGHLSPTDRIEPVLKSATASFGITALNELQQLYNHKPLHEDNTFAYSVLEYINQKTKQFSKEDGRLFAVYGTPAENLCGLQITQFRTKYGIISGVSDNEYVSNSFHCHVTADITPIEKQDKEYTAWESINGGKIQYVRYPIEYNRNAIIALLRRAMDMGFYEGANLQLSFCNDCGYKQVSFGSRCPKCNSENITEIDRMNGYLAYAKLSVRNGDGSFSHYSRLSDVKCKEIEERKSM